MPARSLKKYEKELEKISKNLDKIKKYRETKASLNSWKNHSPSLPNPFIIVRDFIKEKGLKLYGGQALHEHLKKFNKGFYENFEFPDYDVFSPDAWNHAKELTTRLHKMGYGHAEAKGSILNDEHHQTYKVGVDMIYILDLTQVGCTREQMLKKECKHCGETKDKKCISVFNNIPCNDVLKFSSWNYFVYSEIYDYERDSGFYPNKMFVADPNWLKISMYRELSEPLSNPSRLTKVGKRLELFDSYFKYNHDLCEPELYKKEVNQHLLPVLKYIGNYIKNQQLINFGATAHNFFVKSNKNIGNIDVCDYQAYSTDPEKHCKKLKEELKKRFPDFTFASHVNIQYWKEVDVESHIINVSKGSLRYNSIVQFTRNQSCMPYIQYNGVRYVSIDRLKYIYFRSLSLREVTKVVDEHPENYACLISNILKEEKRYKTVYPRSNRTKFRRFTSKCDGVELNKIQQNLIKMSKDKEKTLKNTKFIIDEPKSGYITKVYPSPGDNLKLPFRPDENKRKKYYTKKGNKLIRRMVKIKK
jgi:hypothetical protein